MKTPVLVFVDGIDGSGKSTLVESLQERFLDEDYHHYEKYEHAIKAYSFPSRNPEPHEKADPLGRTLFHINDFYQTMRESRGRADYRIFDRSFVSTMAYQGFYTKYGKSKTNTHFETAFTLGSEALLSQHIPHDINTPKDVYFVHVRCDPEKAASRVAGRNTRMQNLFGVEDKRDDVDRIEKHEDRVQRLEMLQDRFDLCYAYLRLNVGADFDKYRRVTHIVLDSTDKDPDQLLEAATEELKPFIWPAQRSML